MDDTPIHLGPREHRRARILNAHLDGGLSIAQVATLLAVTERQVFRILAAYRRDGPVALVHGNRGRRPWHAIPEGVAERVVELVKERYAEANHTHLAELLAEREDIHLDRTTLRRILLAAGLRSPRPRRAPEHRSRRERMPQAGMLLQGDGSRHRWFGHERPMATLVGAIDDATGRVPAALFRQQEDGAGYLELLWRITERQGLPDAFYLDRHGIFVRRSNEPLTIEEELAGGPFPTQVRRALDELGIAVIHALSPQAKGRIERLWGTLQSRLVVELALEGIVDIATANAFLPGFLERFDDRFGVPARDPRPAWRPLPSGIDLARICCLKYARVVAADHTISFGGRSIQLQPVGRRSLARARVEVQEHLDGSILVLAHGDLVATEDAPLRPVELRARSGPRSVEALGPEPELPTVERVRPVRRGPWVPPKDHPWRK
jgi:transposase